MVYQPATLRFFWFGDEDIITTSDLTPTMTSTSMATTTSNKKKEIIATIAL